MNDKPIALVARRRRLLHVLPALFATILFSAGPALAQKPDFAGKGERGRSDAAKEHAKEQGKGEKKGLYKQDEKDADKDKDDKKKEEKEKKEKKKKEKKEKDDNKY